MTSRDTTSQGPEVTVDARGLTCPMPVLRTRKAMEEVAPGGLLEVVASDRGALKDIPAWARTAGHQVVSTEERDGEIRILIRRGSAHAG